jgi:hypothetical protein
LEHDPLLFLARKRMPAFLKCLAVWNILHCDCMAASPYSCAIDPRHR